MKRHILSILLLLCICNSAFAQLTDDFSDGDFTINPVWSGDVSLFTINAGNQLQSQSPGAATYYLSTPSTLALNAQWEFYINLKFGTSGVNYVDIYVISDEANLINTQNGYFIRVGNTADEISLYKIVGGAETLIIDGTDGIVNSSSNNIFRIKVERDNADNWSLYYDKGDVGSYTLEGSIIDLSVNSSTYFGLIITQSAAASAVNNHYLDEFIVQSIPSDVTPPSLSATMIELPKSIRLTFDEAIENVSAETLTNYTLNNGFGSPTNATQAQVNEVLIEFSTDFISADYSLSINNMEDLNSNVAGTITSDFTVFIPDIAILRDVIITEIFPDPIPTVGLPEAEFVEFYNNSSKTFDLANWKFSDASTIVTLPSFILNPDNYVILCSSANASLFTGYGEVISVSSLPSLNNTSDQLSLKNDSDELIDYVDYSDEWYQDNSKSDGGYTLELINPTNICGGIGNWIASNNAQGGTPGTQNSVYDNTIGSELPIVNSINVISDNQIKVVFSEQLDTLTVSQADFSISGFTITSINYNGIYDVTITTSTSFSEGITYTLNVMNMNDCTGNTINSASVNFEFNVASLRDVIFSEIFPDPTPTAGLPEVEFVEFYNRSDKSFNLANWKFSDASSSVTLPSFQLAPDSYVILCSNANASLFTGFGDVISVPSLPSLNNASDQLTLKNEIDELIDYIGYSDDWYQDNNKSDGGYTLELINPDNVCGGIENWKASNDPSGGTPGAQNSVFNLSTGSELPTVINIIPISSSFLLIEFSETLDSLSIALSDFTINGISIASYSLDQNTIALSLSDLLTSGNMYTLTISDLDDCSGNTIISDNYTFEYLENPALDFKDVVITEIMANPNAETSVANAEYIEVLNLSSSKLNLSGWQLSDGSTIGMLGFYILEPSEYLVLTKSTNASLFNSSLPVLGLTTFPTLNNTADNITLKSNSAELLDSVAYKSSWYRSSIKDDGGFSLEIIDPDNFCSNEFNWIASEDPSGGTPGIQNSVFAEMVDYTGPKLLSVYGISSELILLNFDEEVDSQSLQSALITLSNNLSIINIQTDDLKSIYLHLDSTTPLQNGVNYQVTISNLTDCPGNQIQANFNSANFSLIEEADPGDILINEILFNPRSGGVDFVELINISTKYISLQNWKLANADDFGDSLNLKTIRTISDTYKIINPGGYLALTSDKILLKDQYPKGVEANFYELSSLPSYPDDDGSVVLLNSNGDITDYFTYSEDYHSKVINDEEGVSLERISTLVESNLPENWFSAAASENYATPGYLNSQSRKSISIQTGEIIIEPKVIVPDGDGIDDFATISYSFDQPGYVLSITIMDLQGREIRTLATNDFVSMEGFYTWDGSDNDGKRVRIGYYIVYVEAFNANGSVEKFKEKIVIGTRF